MKIVLNNKELGRAALDYLLKEKKINWYGDYCVYQVQRAKNRFAELVIENKDK